MIQEWRKQSQDLIKADKGKKKKLKFIFSEMAKMMILVAVTMIFWVSMMNKLYYDLLIWNVTILFSSSKLLNVKCKIHLSLFFLFFNTCRPRGVQLLREPSHQHSG
jgi:hypothetical protein